MFSKFPTFTVLENYKTPGSIIKAFQFYHSTVSNTSYRSRGFERTNETHCIFHYTVKGHGEVIYNGVPYKTSAGEGFFNIINDDTSGYGYPNFETEPWEFVVICFEGSTLRKTIKDILQEKVVYAINKPEMFCSLCKKLLEIDNKGMRLTFFQRLLELLYSSNNTQQKLIVEFHDNVEKYLLSNPTIDAISFLMKISREHLQREYLKQTGKTPASYLNKKRFEKLIYLLSSNLSDKEIVQIMNFPSVASLSSFFKKNTGYTLKQYRKNGYTLI